MVILSDEAGIEPLRLVEAVCNTYNHEDGVDVLDAGWFAERGLLREGSRLSGDELARARAVREALRELALANNGDEAGLAAAGRVLDRQARRSALAVRFRPSARLEPAARGVDGALGEVLAAAAAAMADATWHRLKACHAETC